jgi:hypothetical protein
VFISIMELREWGKGRQWLIDNRALSVEYYHQCAVAKGGVSCGKNSLNLYLS